jgi:hypothetical protein
LQVWRKSFRRELRKGMSEVVKYHESEQVNKPHWKRFKLQGKNKYLALAHKNTEIKYYMTGPNGEQIVIEQPDRDISQDEPTTATVVAMSKDWDYENYPDVKIGCNIETTINSWYTWTGASMPAVTLKALSRCTTGAATPRKKSKRLSRKRSASPARL